MFSNYPPGVTGNEYQISGPEREWVGTRTVYCTDEECKLFEEEVDAEGDYASHGHTLWFTWRCESCKKLYEGDYEYNPEDFMDY